MKTKKKRSKATRNTPVEYTHRDTNGLGWRMSGSRPVSAIADKIMREMGLPLR